MSLTKEEAERQIIEIMNRIKIQFNIDEDDVNDPDTSTDEEDVNDPDTSTDEEDVNDPDTSTDEEDVNDPDTSTDEEEEETIQSTVSHPSVGAVIPTKTAS